MGPGRLAHQEKVDLSSLLCNELLTRLILIAVGVFGLARGVGESPLHLLAAAVKVQ